MAGEIATRPLGTTGEQVSVIGFGGWHLGLSYVDEQTSIRLVRESIDRGITFMDNCWDYNDGTSEIRMGKALWDGYRQKAFLMTKIDGRSRKEAARQLDECLRRLQTDCIDLVQHHEILRYEDPHRVLDENGANAALVEAQRAGKLRYIGFTGHKDPHIFLYMLEVARQRGVRFDAVQMPLNVMDAHFRSFEKLVLPELVRDGIAVLGMKSMSSGVILRSGVVTALECLKYTLRLPVSVLITGIDKLEYIDQACEAARTYGEMTHEEVAEILARTAGPAAHGIFEPFKTTSGFDGTAQNPDWMGEEPEHVQAMMPAQ
jgi:aryl-alcohol dehydrogenase-like predicted oxidoreductase